jgi:hypothetical protein
VCVQPVKKNDSPEWEERFQFILQEPPTGDTLHVEVKSKDSDMLGKITHHKVSPATAATRGLAKHLSHCRSD